MKKACFAGIIILLAALHINKASGQELQLVGSYQISSLNYIFMGGIRVYLAASDTLIILDIANPANPALLGSYTAPDNITDLVVSGDYAYLSIWFVGLYIVDISNPEAPQYVGTYPYGSYTGDIDLIGNYIYMADFNGEYIIINISNPQEPAFTGSLDTPGAACDLDVAGNYAYIADAEFGLTVANIDDPANPTIIGNNSRLWVAIGLDVSNNYAYLAALDAGLRIVDISQPSDPQQISLYVSGHRPIDVAVSGVRALIAEEESGLEVVDISNPQSPSHVETYDTPGITRNVRAVGDYVYVGDSRSLLIFRLNPLAIGDEYEPLPDRLRLSQNYPNPFNAQTTISYSLPQAGPVTLYIYNIMGQKVATLVDGIEQAGEHRVVWDAKGAASGIYFYELETSGLSKCQKMILVR
jgi:hypothetical protein